MWTIPSTAAQEDFVVLTKNITFQPGETGPKLIEIDVIDDDIVEPTEAFTVTLISPVAVELGEPATVNIIDNDGKLNKLFHICTARNGQYPGFQGLFYLSLLR